jgi:Ran GTPase-activating protein (RanGAP) involved in mRNA processing and transport
MCQIIVKLLHKNPQYRYQSLQEVRVELAKLQDNITQTPVTLR